MKIYISYGIKICDHILHYQLLIPNEMTFDELHRTLSFWKIDSTLFIKSGCQYTSSFLRNIIFRFLCLALTRNKLWNKKCATKLVHQKPDRNQKLLYFCHYKKIIHYQLNVACYVILLNIHYVSDIVIIS